MLHHGDQNARAEAKPHAQHVHGQEPAAGAAAAAAARRAHHAISRSPSGLARRSDVNCGYEKHRVRVRVYVTVRARGGRFHEIQKAGLKFHEIS